MLKTRKVNRSIVTSALAILLSAGGLLVATACTETPPVTKAPGTSLADTEEDPTDVYSGTGAFTATLKASDASVAGTKLKTFSRGQDRFKVSCVKFKDETGAASVRYVEYDEKKEIVGQFEISFLNGEFANSQLEPTTDLSIFYVDPQSTHIARSDYTRDNCQIRIQNSQNSAGRERLRGSVICEGIRGLLRSTALAMTSPLPTLDVVAEFECSVFVI